MEGEAQPHINWSHHLQEAIKPFTSEGIYINLLVDEGEAHVRASYGMNYERLVRIKDSYHPTNVFHFNQNIKPAVL